MFGETLFSSSPFIRWSLTPVLVCFAIFMPLAIPHGSATTVVIIAGIEIGALALLAGLWLPRQIGVAAFRLVAALVFLAYAAYLITECRDWMRDDSAGTSQQGQRSPLNALMGLVIIGLPSLKYAWKGRFK